MAGGAIPPGQAQIFQQAGAQYHIPPAVLAGIASVESNLGANKNTSPTGAQGEMQFEPGTAKSAGVNPYNTRSAIFGAAKLLNSYGFQQNPLRAIGAYNGGPGNPQMGYAAQVMSEASRLHPQLLASMGSSGGVAGAMRMPSSITTTSGGGPDYASAGIAALLSAAAKPISMSGKFSASDPLSGMLSNVQSGNFNLPTSSKTVKLPGGGGASTQLPPSFKGGSSYVNPLPGSVFTRTDQGVDGTTHTFLAPAQSRIIIADRNNPGWKGGGYIAGVILSGPDKGKVWYAAEGVAPNVHVGQQVGAGFRIGAPVVNPYNGIVGNYEWGWANPANPAQPLAQVTGSYSEGAQTGAGKAARAFLNGLGAGAGANHS